MCKIVILSVDESEVDIIERIKSVLQPSSVVNVEKVEASNTIRTGDLVIDSAQHTVYKRAKEIILTNIEFRILYFLAVNKGMVMSKEQIYDYVWNGEYIFDDSNITSHIRRLRMKIEDDTTKPKYIQTVRGIGYKMPKVGGVHL